MAKDFCMFLTARKFFSTWRCLFRADFVEDRGALFLV